MGDYTVLVDIGRVDPDTVDLDPLADWHTIAAGTPLGTVELVLTLPADTLRQAVTTALTVVAAAGHHPHAVRALPTTDYDAGHDLPADTATLSVPEAARLLHVTPQAIRARLAAGTLPGRRIGRDWRIPRTVINHTTTPHPRPPHDQHTQPA